MGPPPIPEGCFGFPAILMPAKPGSTTRANAAVTYLRNETGNYFNEKAIEAFLDQGPRMLEFFERETEAKFLLSGYPDYHPDVEGRER